MSKLPDPLSHPANAPEPVVFDDWLQSEYEGVEIPAYWLDAMKHAWAAARASQGGSA